eukprot:TRINITY_DN46223_c0_g1_i1.p1 TRINITY_DN46223_c0_g1~~TRINITY_DN46223_c0_g1_i1.p1  ORF type:complete len:180 (-),score=14.76 TRINITY_DN46223_c0_g1_i1:462-1001(-)
MPSVKLSKKAKQRRSIPKRCSTRLSVSCTVNSPEELTSRDDASGTTTLKIYLDGIPPSSEMVIEQAILEGISQDVAFSSRHGQQFIRMSWPKPIPVSALQQLLRDHQVWWLMFKLMNCMADEWKVSYSASLVPFIEEHYKMQSRVCPYETIPNGALEIDISNQMNATLNEAQGGMVKKK